MSNLALYRRYRSSKFSEVYGQDHIVKPLANAIKSGVISHAYLFSGPRGVGKTSVARILAYEINGLPYKVGEQNIDIIEIDAASNRRIDEIRDLREKVHIAPVSTKYKVYIIDEVHMLTREAFNALLKTLEEPPEHVVFILATTEAHKLPATIISRTQRHTFRPIADDVMKQHLQTIASNENILIDEDALELVAAHGDGSFRDAISLLDQLRPHAEAGKLTARAVRELLGLPPEKALISIAKSIEQADPKSLLTMLKDLYTQGITASTIAEELIRFLRTQHRYTSNVGAGDIELVDKLLEVSAARQPELKLEVVLLDHALNHQPVRPVEEEPTTKAVKEKVEPTPKTKITKIPAKPTSVVEETTKKIEEPEILKTKATQEFDQKSWTEILQEVKKRNNALYAVLRMAEARGDSQNIELVFKYPFHQRRAAESRNKQLIKDVFHNKLNKRVTIEMIVDQTLPSQPAVATVASSHTETILNTFGGGEVVNL